MLALKLFHPSLLAQSLQVFELSVESLHCTGCLLLEASKDLGLVRGVESFQLGLREAFARIDRLALF